MGLLISPSPIPIATVVVAPKRNEFQRTGDRSEGDLHLVIVTVKLAVFAGSAARIRYSIDGGSVNRSSALYTSPLHLPQGTQLRAVGDVPQLELGRELIVNL
jgi:hypothetical protein